MKFKRRIASWEILKETLRRKKGIEIKNNGRKFGENGKYA